MGTQNGVVGETDRMVFEPRLGGGHLFFQDLKIIGFGVLQEFFAQLEAADFRDTRIVLDFLGNGHLPAENAPFDEHGFEGGTHGVDPGSEAGGAAADNDQIVYFVVGHLILQIICMALLCYLFRRRLSIPFFSGSGRPRWRQMQTSRS
ncbi:MAG: hypothetical protein ACD_75C00365G0001 [uncultured bacterium]|nr:MAG: hypothetical protein ACD_75C00365G0001 [uncultured bacterium]